MSITVTDMMHYCTSILTITRFNLVVNLFLPQPAHHIQQRIHPLQLSYTPGGSERCTRLVEESFTPKLGMQFVDFDSAMCFFVVYAIFCGFEPRLYTTKRTRGGELLRKSIVCNRQGYRENKNKLKCPVEKDSTAKPYVSRNVKVTRIGCPAMMRVEATGGGDFKNFARDVKCYIGLKDATLFVNHLEELAKIKSGFYFAHEIDDQKCLSRVIWSDAESRKNYAEFGDALSFDATYGTNKYDQDAGMLLAIPNVFKTARHRFCMWHIMEKVSSKVGAIICKETDFLSRLHSVVWDSTLEPKEFEEKWLAVMNDFNLVGHKWLSSMYREKHCWIPAYFRDMPMGGLLRTTQRSESSNSFYKRYQTHFGTLVEFWMRFESAMEQQRLFAKMS
ncbi:protein FAR1-RELATED SEQUENCE 5-like [Silene latifolia]|uniref:protein FAR1-RELATED SEQUENCE 5-like n=1 Tax=Silene latifolia TaxID=37657 RepID=UPI003D7820D7